MKPHTPAATGTTNSFDVNHKANHCQRNACWQPVMHCRKSLVEMLIAVDVPMAFISARLQWNKSQNYDVAEKRKISLSSFAYMKL